MLEPSHFEVQGHGHDEEASLQLEAVLERGGDGKKLITRNELIKLHELHGHRASLWENIRHSSRILPMHKKVLEDIKTKCKVCIKFAKTPSKKKASFAKALDFNTCVSLDLKELVQWNKYILYMICEFTRLVKGKIIDDKKATTVFRALNESWIIGQGMGPGLPEKLHADNGKEFTNDMLSEFSNKMGIKLSFSAAHSPWQNGVNERGHGTVDLLFFKILSDNSDLSLQEALNLACYTKNCEINKTGFSALQIVYGRSPKIISNFEPTVLTMDVVNDSEMARVQIDRIRKARLAYRQLEVDAKIKIMLNERIKGWTNYSLNQGDAVWFKNKRSLWKQGNIIAIEGQVIHILSEGSTLKIPRSNVRPDETLMRELSVRSGLDVSDSHTDKFNGEAKTKQKGILRKTQDLEHSKKSTRYKSVQFSDKVTVARQDEDRPKWGSLVKILELDGNIFAGKVTQVGKKSGRMKDWIWVSDDNETWIYDVKKDGIKWEYLSEQESEDLNLINLFQDSNFCFVQLIKRKDQNNETVFNAKKAEIDNWMRLNVIEKVRFCGQSLIPCNWVVTKKEVDDKGTGRVKARLVARGDLEPTDERTDSPTAGKESIKLFLALTCINNFNVICIDIRAAFLQGQPPERYIFLRPPDEFKETDIVWLLKRPVYGLRDASRAWYKALYTFFTAIGMKTITGDKAFFYIKINNTLQLIIVSHVDDFLVAGTEFYLEWFQNKLKTGFEISKVERNQFAYTGMDLQISPHKSIICSQSSYLSNLLDFDVAKYKDLQEKVDANAIRLIKQAIGKLNWIALSTRPDLQFDSLELSMNINEAKFERLKRANKIYKRAREETYDVKLNFLRMPIPNMVKLLVFTDASFGNLQDKIRSTEGRITFLKVGDNIYPLAWKARKLEKVCLCVKTAETLALINGIDEAILFKQILETLLNCKINIMAFTDNHALKESIYSTKGLTERRMERALEFLRECIATGDVEVIKWIDTKSMLADCLTKRGAKASDLKKFLQTGKMTDDQFLNLVTQSCGEQLYASTNESQFLGTTDILCNALTDDLAAQECTCMIKCF